MAEDLVRVLRVVEYIGPRRRVEQTVAGSIHGTKEAGGGLTIRAATIGEYPEILGNEVVKIDPFAVPRSTTGEFNG
jgi:hypothetical protein